MMKHYSVLLQGSIDNLAIHSDETYVDGTLGRGGHSAEILAWTPQGYLYAFDRDTSAIEESRERLAQIGNNVTSIYGNFSNLKRELTARGVTDIDGMVLDLGVPSPQFDEAQCGFSYHFDVPLDMRMDQSQKLSVYQVANKWEYRELVRILFQFGEESFAKQIARKTEKAREVKPIETTSVLVSVIKSVLPTKVLDKKGHPAKKVFQAIRTAVNDELEELQLVLRDVLELLHVGERLRVISFQSLEDRIAKDTFASCNKPKQYDKRIPILPQDMEAVPYRLLNKKLIIATEEELRENMHSHSTKLRRIEKIK